MTDLMPEFCPHCLADLSTTEVKTSGIPKCGRCLLPLWWADRSGKTPDVPWPSYVRMKEQVRGALEGMRSVEGERDAVRGLLLQFRDAFRDLRDSYEELEDLSRKVGAL